MKLKQETDTAKLLAIRKIVKSNVDVYYTSTACTVYIAREFIDGHDVLHLSISHKARYPSWDEIKFVRYELMPEDIEVVMWLPKKQDYVNVHPNCFHLVEYKAEKPVQFLPWYLRTQIGWSKKTFGETPRTEGIIKHIESELDEIRKNPTDVTEWIDVIILALDGYWRHGGDPERIEVELAEKQYTNMQRKYDRVPDDQPSFHKPEVEQFEETATEAAKIISMNETDHVHIPVKGLAEPPFEYCCLCNELYLP